MVSQGNIEFRIFQTEEDYSLGKLKKSFSVDSSSYRYEKDLLFEINENSVVEIEFYANSIMKLYVQSFDLEYSKKEIDGVFVIYAKDYSIGNWYFLYEYLNHSYKRFFRINPFGGIDEAGLMTIRDVIESISPGLSYDLSKSKFRVKLGDSLPNVARLKYNTLISRKDAIARCLKNIIENPICSLEKTVEKGKEVKKQNQKSILLNLRKPNEKYSTKVEQVINNSENAMLYYVLITIRKQCQYIMTQLEFNVIAVSNEVVILDSISETNRLNKYYSEMSESYKEALENFNRSISEINDIQSKINDCITALSLMNLPMNKKVMTVSFMKNHNYRYLFDVYNLMITDHIDLLLEKENGERVIDYKSTDILFELYNYCIIKKVIMDLGYIPYDNVEHLLNFKANFFNHKERIEVYYNTKFKTYTDITMDYQGLINYGIYHDTPDFAIVKYDENDEAKSIIILDAKCRKIYNIFPNGEIDKGILKGLLDYYRLRYKPENQKINNLAVSEVICTYPYSKDKPFLEDSIGGISYIGLKLVKNYENDQSFLHLKSKLEEYLK